MQSATEIKGLVKKNIRDKQLPSSIKRDEIGDILDALADKTEQTDKTISEGQGAKFVNGANLMWSEANFIAKNASANWMNGRYPAYGFWIDGVGSACIFWRPGAEGNWYGLYLMDSNGQVNRLLLEHDGVSSLNNDAGYIQLGNFDQLLADKGVLKSKFFTGRGAKLELIGQAGNTMWSDSQVVAGNTFADWQAGRYPSYGFWIDGVESASLFYRPGADGNYYGLYLMNSVGQYNRLVLEHDGVSSLNNDAGYIQLGNFDALIGEKNLTTHAEVMQMLGNSGFLGIGSPNHLLQNTAGYVTGSDLFPQITKAARDLMQNPPKGKLYFNTTAGTFDFHTGSAWLSLSTGGLKIFDDGTYGLGQNAVKTYAAALVVDGGFGMGVRAPQFQATNSISVDGPNAQFSFNQYGNTGTLSTRRGTSGFQLDILNAADATAIKGSTTNDVFLRSWMYANFSYNLLLGSYKGIAIKIFGNSQNVGIGEDATDDPSAIFNVTSTTKGALTAPRMTTIQRDAILNPTKSLEIFNITTNRKNYFDGTLWQEIINLKDIAGLGTSSIDLSRYRFIDQPYQTYIAAITAATGAQIREMQVVADPDPAKNGRYFYDGIQGKLEKVGTASSNAAKETIYGTLSLSAQEGPNNTFTLNWVKNRPKLYNGGMIFGIGSSTMAGFGATTNNKATDVIQKWLDANTTDAQLINAAVSGTSSPRYMPDGTSSQVTGNRNITAAIASRPACIIIFLPTNDIADAIPPQTFFDNVYAMWNQSWLLNGIPTFVIGPQPRTGFTPQQKADLKTALGLFRAAFPSEFFIDVYELFNDGNDNTKAEYQYSGDQIHLNDTGHLLLANTITARLAAYFVDQTYLQYEIEVANQTGFELFDTITSPTVISKTYNRLDGLPHTYRIRGKKADASYSDYSQSVTFTQAAFIGTLEETIQLDLGINTDPANTALGWNDLRVVSTGATAGTAFGSLVNSTGVLSSVAMNVVKPFYGSGSNYQPGTFANYPAYSTQDYWSVLQTWADPAEIQFTGLDKTKIYELDFISSWKGSDNRRFVVLDSGNSYDRGRGTTSSLNVANTTDVRTLRRLIPAADGTINIKVRALGTAGYLNTLILKRYATEIITDTTAPNPPSGLTSSAVTQTTFTLGWNPAWDNIGTISYDIYRDGVLISTTKTLSYPVTGLVASTTYGMTVKAKDASGNISTPSVLLNVRTADVPAPDTTAPTAPGTPTATGLTQTSFTLNWGASTDNTGVTGYQIYKDGVLLGTTTTALSYFVSALNAGTSYTMSVKAIDAAGNVSAASAAVITTSAPVPDSQAPTAPSNLTKTSVLDTNFTLGWTASTDNIAVTAYDIYKDNVLLATTSNVSYPVTGLAPTTTYSFTVIAKDAAGNQSPASAALAVTTLGPVVAKEIMVNVYAGTNPYNNTSWNNWNVGQTATPPDSASLTDTAGLATGIIAQLSAQDVSGVKDNGTTYSATVTIFPVEVARYTSASAQNSPRTLTIKGLDNTKQYTIELYNNRQFASNSTVFTISGYPAVTILNNNNNSSSAIISGVTPVNGQIVVNLSATSTAGISYLNGFKIRYIG